MLSTPNTKTKLSLLVLLGLTIVVSGWFLAESSDENTVEASSVTIAEQVRDAAFEELTQEANQTGKVKVIIGVNARFTPEGALSDIEKLRQREEIQSTQDDVLQKLTSFYVRSVKRFRFIPYFAAEVDVETLEALRKDPMVKSIEPDEIASPTLLESTQLVGSPQAWAAGYTGTNWAVAILDTGVEANHPFFGGRVVSEACYSTNATTTNGNVTSFCPGGVPQSTDIGSAIDCPTNVSGCGHGTHVAGIAAGSGESYSGVAKGAPIIAIQVFSRFDNTTDCGGTAPCARTYQSDYIRGLERVLALSATMNIASANMSLGGGQFLANCDVERQSIKLAVDNLRTANIATVIASGNNGYTAAMSAPGCISTAISVGSTSKTSNSISSFSNSANFLNLLAPGSSILASVTGGVYGTKSGTSMATPHVAGAWSVLKQHTPTATVDQILSAISATGFPLVDSRNSIIKPRLQLNDALQGMGCSYGLGTGSQTVSAGGGSATVNVTTGPNCLWKTGSAASWITVNSSSSATGAGSVSLTVAPNVSSSSRTGRVLIAGITHTITQDAASCSLSLASSSQSVPASGGSGSVGINASESFCTWNAVVAPPQTFNAEAGTLGAIPDSTLTGPQAPGDAREVQFVVSGVNTASVTNIAVSFTGNHTYVGDVEATLIAPNGTQHRVFGYTLAVASGDFGSSRDLNGTYVFTDLATQNWWTAVAGTANPITSGNYRTSNSGGAGATNPMPDTSIMSTFSSLTNMNGTWTLRFTDGGNGDTGAVSAANIQFVSGTPWLSLNGSTSGSGTGVIQYSVAENTSQTSRTGYISVAGQLFTITQAGAAAPPSGSIAGTVRYYFGTSPLAVPGVGLSATGAQNVSGSSGSNGAFSLTGFGSGAYTLTPSKTGDATTAAISALDASTVAQYSVQLITLTANQQTAADVTNDGTISALDASQIAQWSVGLSTTGLTGTWRFTPSTRTYSSVTESLTGQDFTAILMGDVTGNWTSSSSIYQPEQKSFTDRMVNDIDFKMPKSNGESSGIRSRWAESVADKKSADEIIEIPITVNGALDLLSYDAVISFDEETLEPVLEAPVRAIGSLSTNFNLVVNRSEPGRMRIAAYGIVPVVGDGDLLYLRFRVKRSGEAKVSFDSLILNEQVRIAPRVGIVGSERKNKERLD